MNLEFIGLYRRDNTMGYATIEQQKTAPNAPLLSIQVGADSTYMIYYDHKLIQIVPRKELTVELIIDLLYNQGYPPALAFKRSTKIERFFNE